jgi:hypothetical protein
MAKNYGAILNPPSSILHPQFSLENLRFSLASAFSERWCEDGAATDAQQRPGFQ